MVRQCVICKQNSKAFSYHKVPKSASLRSQWKRSMRMPRFVLCDRSIICSAHFTEDCFVPMNVTGKSYLKSGSVPTIIDVNSGQTGENKKRIDSKPNSIPNNSIKPEIVSFGNMPAWCNFCSKEFSQRGSLQRHLVEVHGMDDNEASYSDNKFKCLEGCHVSFTVNSELVSHLQMFHNIVIEKEELEFSCKSDYLLCLKNFFKQQDMDMEYIKTTRNLDENSEMIYYNCCCAEKTKPPNDEVNSRKHKLQNQSTNRGCTSQIIVKKQEDSYTVTLYKTHYGHNRDDYNDFESKPESSGIKRRRFEDEEIPAMKPEILREEIENELSNIQRNLYNVIDIQTLSKALHILQNTNDFLVTNFDHFEYFYDVVEDIEVVIDDYVDGQEMGKPDQIEEYYLNSRDDIELNSKNYLSNGVSMEKGEEIISNDSQFDHCYYLCH